MRRASEWIRLRAIGSPQTLTSVDCAEPVVNFVERLLADPKLSRWLNQYILIIENISVRGVSREFEIWQSHTANENLVGAYTCRRLKIYGAAGSDEIVLIDAITTHTQSAN